MAVVNAHSSQIQQQSDVDELFDVKNLFYIGNFQQCINEAQKVKIVLLETKLERDVFVYKAYIAQKKYKIVIDEISEKSPVELQVLKLLSEFFVSPNEKQNILQTYLDKFSVFENENHHVVMAAATIYIHDDQFENALQVLHRNDHLECLSVALQIYISMSRIDLARKELKKMQEKDEDSLLTQLAQAWVNIAMGRDKLEDAYYIIQEIIDKYGSSVNLLNCQAVCYIVQGKYEEADSALQEAMEKDNNNPDTLINSIVLSAHLNKPSEVTSRYLMQLKESHFNTGFIKDLNIKENEFNELFLEYETKNILEIGV
ncbi:hypothetical protein PGB90_006349 [Kerria lacca]